ncbi:hypothetical protein [Streptomyces griseus]|uniref:hypothetical protein n=1 Tax=Streptomyces griseus TaxID=1911 RepID=UPI000564DD0A|nr:hypothetical protein [Streptomyces griseus]
MSKRVHLLLRAARAYAEAGAHAEAARCYDTLGWRWSAADAYHRAGDLEHAAETYRRAGHPERAARCFRLLGRPDRAARCWQETGSPLEAGWELLVADLTEAAAPLLAAAARTPPTAPAPLLRLALARALYRWTVEGGGRGRAVGTGMLLGLLAEVEQGILTVSSRIERLRLLEWGVETADRIGRFDVSAALFGAAHRPRQDQSAARAEVLAQWQEWAALRLGGTAWLPLPDTTVAG